MPDGATTARLLDALGELTAEAAERGRRTLVSVTVEVEALDPAAVAFASRLASDRWFCWEQPDRDGFAVAGIGAAWEVVSRGAGRFAEVEASCAELAHERLGDEPAGLPPGAGPLWAGGFAFAPDGGGSPPWSSFPPALVSMPEVAVARVAGATYLTLGAVV